MKKVIILLTIILAMLSLSACSAEKDLIEARQEAYDIGYENGHSFGYSQGYSDAISGKNMNVYSEFDEENLTNEMVYYIVDGDKFYHKLDCIELEGKTFFPFSDNEKAKAAGFEPCSVCH